MLAVLVVAIMVLGSFAVPMGLLGGETAEEEQATIRLPDGRTEELPEDERPRTEEEVKDLLEEEGLIEEEDRDLPLLEIFRDLSDLEWRTQFVNVNPYHIYYRVPFMIACCDVAVDTDDDGLRDVTIPNYKVPQPSVDERQVEEADIVKLVDDLMYILNPYRGLQIVDLHDPDNPVLLGRAPVMGTPVDLYVVGTRAIVITSTTMTFWYQYTRAEWTSWRGEDDVSFRMGSEISLVDVSDPTSPSVVRELGVEGYITDTRRVGDVLYVVSNQLRFYGHESVGNYMDCTNVMSINLAEPESAYLVDQASFLGSSNHIHVTGDLIYVAQALRSSEGGSSYTDITIVDITDPYGEIVLCDRFSVDGFVEDRFQLDQFQDTFRVISHQLTTQNGRRVENSELWIFDVGDITSVEQLSHMVIDDAGDLMATRFAGDRAYTIHLPRNMIDPLDVMDLSDPRNPELTCVLEIPGWVDHLAVKGNKIIAVGVDQTWNQKVAITMFNVSDPCNATVDDRIVLEGKESWSQANWDPKSITFLDDEGLMLIPYASTENRYYNGRVESGVKVITFDLEAGDLEVAGSYQQVGAVTRTRILGDRVVSTSVKYLQVADLTDPYDPIVTAMVELTPYLVDAHVTDSYIAELVQRHSDHNFSLRVMITEYREGEPAAGRLDLEMRPFDWVWSGSYLYLFHTRGEEGVTWVEVTTVDLTVPVAPWVCDRLSFNVQGPVNAEALLLSEDCPYNMNQGGLVLVDDFSYYRHPYYVDDVQYDDVWLLDEGLMVFLNGADIYCINLFRPNRPYIASTLPMGDVEIADVRTAGRTLFVTTFETHEMDTQGYRVTPTEYWLARIDITYPDTPRHLPVLNIPGVPQGVSPHGTFMYTTASWLFEGGLYTKTLNIVWLGYDLAWLTSTYNITHAYSVHIDGDLAIVNERTSGHLSLTLLDLDPITGIEEVATVQVDGYLRKPVVVNGHMFLSGYNEDGMMVYSLTSSDIQEVGFFPLDRTVSSVKVLDGTAYVVQGMYGLTAIPLTTAAAV